LEKSLKVLLINGSPRKQNTYNILSQIEVLLRNDKFETELINISDFKIEKCTGCYMCMLKGYESCPYKNDDVKVIDEKIKESDGVVIGSPVFALSVSGLLKNFMDRIIYNTHRPEMYNKPLLLISTTAGMGTGNVIRQLKWFEIMGMKTVGSKGFVVYPYGKVIQKIENKLKMDCLKLVQNLENAMTKKKKPKASLLKVIQFYGLKLNSELGKSVYVADYKYYKERQYFIKMKINPIKKMIGKLVYSIGYRYLKKTVTIEE
jgi:multimeric flavodoxin WrbA